MKIPVVDVGGNNVKMLARGQKRQLKFSSGHSLTPDKMVDGQRKVAASWQHDAISIGIPGPVLPGQLILDHRNLGPGWVDYDFSRAFGGPVKLINHAAERAA